MLTISRWLHTRLFRWMCVCVRAFHSTTHGMVFFWCHDCNRFLWTLLWPISTKKLHKCYAIITNPIHEYKTLKMWYVERRFFFLFFFKMLYICATFIEELGVCWRVTLTLVCNVYDELSYTLYRAKVSLGISEIFSNFNSLRIIFMNSEENEENEYMKSIITSILVSFFPHFSNIRFWDRSTVRMTTIELYGCGMDEKNNMRIQWLCYKCIIDLCMAFI